MLFTYVPEVRESIGELFGLQRGADVLVYGAIIFTIYMSLLLLSKSEDNKHATTKLVRELAIESSEKKNIKANTLVLMRVYNEAQVLENTLDGLIGHWYESILIINDGSRDNSWEIIHKYTEKNRNIISVKHSQNRGWGAALETGFEYIRRYGDIGNIITFDADGQHNPKEIAKFIEVSKKESSFEVLFGSRFMREGSYDNMPFFRKCILKWGRIFTRVMSWAILTDPHNGFRLIKMQALSKIYLNADSMAYASEMIEKIMKHNIPYGEVPVHIEYTDYSLWKWQKSSNAIFIALHTIWSKFFQ